MKDYKDNFDNAIDFAVKKTNLIWWKLILLGIMGCVYVGLSYIAFILIMTGMQDPSIFADGWKENLLVNNVIPKINSTGWPLMLAAGIFPVGLLLIVFLGGSLFTSDNLTSIAILTKQVKIPPVIMKWFLTLFGNLIGAFIIAALARGSHIFNDKNLFILQQIISKKIIIEWWQSFFSGILCNVLVAGTVWSTLAAKHSIAKIFLIYFPIVLFAIVGFQHVTANSILFAFGWTHADNPLMQTIGQGVLNNGNTLTLSQWSFASVFINMIPAMVGNWLSGAIFLPFIYFWLSDTHKRIKREKKTLLDEKNNLDLKKHKNNYIDGNNRDISEDEDLDYNDFSNDENYESNHSKRIVNTSEFNSTAGNNQYDPYSNNKEKRKKEYYRHDQFEKEEQEERYEEDDKY